MPSLLPRESTCATSVFTAPAQRPSPFDHRVGFSNSFTRLLMGSLTLRPTILLFGNSRPRVATTPLPHATEAYGQLPGRDFNPLDLLLLLRTEKSAVDGTRNSGFLSAFEMTVNIFSETQALAGISRHKPSNQAQANERARVGYAFSDFFNTIGSTKTVSPALPIQMCPSCTVALICILRSASFASACVASIGMSMTSRLSCRASAT